MESKVTTVRAYLESLPPDRRRVISELRLFILKHLPNGYEEGIQYGMLSYFIPLERFPNTYNGEPLAMVSLASQKNYCSLYLNTVYNSTALLRLLENGFQANNKKLDMGKSCLRFRSLEELHLPTLAEIIGAVPPQEFIKIHEQGRARS